MDAQDNFAADAMPLELAVSHWPDLWTQNLSDNDFAADAP